MRDIRVLLRSNGQPPLRAQLDVGALKKLLLSIYRQFHRECQ
jgi:hypothetical protein